MGSEQGQRGWGCHPCGQAERQQQNMPQLTKCAGGAALTQSDNPAPSRPCLPPPVMPPAAAWGRHQPHRQRRPLLMANCTPLLLHHGALASQDNLAQALPSLSSAQSLSCHHSLPQLPPTWCPHWLARRYSDQPSSRLGLKLAYTCPFPKQCPRRRQGALWRRARGRGGRARRAQRGRGGRVSQGGERGEGGGAR